MITGDQFKLTEAAKKKGFTQPMIVAVGELTAVGRLNKAKALAKLKNISTNISPEFVEMAGGNIFFKLPGYKYNICYEPIFNRGILFPSNYLHKSTSFTRFIIDLRVSVAWKLIEII